jgi:hypothetical protein
MTFPLNETVTWEKAGELNARGKPEDYDDPETLDVWLVERTERVIGPSGEEVTSKMHFHTPGDVAIGFQDRITLPDGATPPIVAIGRPRTPEGVHRTKCWF